MTFKEKLQKENPEYINSMVAGGCMGCPQSYGYETPEAAGCKGEHRDVSDERCTACWNREIPGTEPRLKHVALKMGTMNIKPGLSWPPLDREGSFVDYCAADVWATTLLNTIYGAPKVYIPDIKKVIFNDPATIVIWADGEKTVVKCQNGEPYDPEKGLAMAITKRALGNKGNYFDEIKKWTKEYDVKCAYPEIVEIHMDETESNKLEELVQGMVKRRKIGRDEV